MCSNTFWILPDETVSCALADPLWTMLFCWGMWFCFFPIFYCIMKSHCNRMSKIYYESFAESIFHGFTLTVQLFTCFLFPTVFLFIFPQLTTNEDNCIMAIIECPFYLGVLSILVDSSLLGIIKSINHC